MDLVTAAKSIPFLAEYAKGIASLDEKGRLLEAYNAALMLQGRVHELDAEVRSLTEKLRFKEQVRFDRNAVWAEGDPNPYCSACWEGKRDAVHLLQTHTQGLYRCPHCKSEADVEVRPMTRDRRSSVSRVRPPFDNGW